MIPYGYEDSKETKEEKLKVKLTYNSKISLKENFNNAFKFDNEEFKKSALGNGTPLVPEQPQAAQE